MSRWLFALALAVPAIAGCTQSTSSSAPAAALTGGTGPAVTEPSVVPEGFETIGITLREAGGATRELCLWLAATSDQRQQGLMQVTDLGGRDGMLFQFDAPTTGTFWMFQTVMPLSIAFFDDVGAFVSSTDMEPCPPDADCPSYRADSDYVDAIEVPQGGLDELGIGPGSAIVGRRACSA
jgi:uncharacterized membrane protein (UPF0127 family)